LGESPNAEVEVSERPQRRSLNHQLWILAKCYIDSANILSNQVSKTGNGDPLPAMIMCTSFSIELVLKCLLVVTRDEIRTIGDLEGTGIDLRGHDFIALFDKVEARYQAVVLEQMTLSISAIKTMEDLRTWLRELGSDPFTFWRYVYEQDRIPKPRYGDIKRFGGALWRAINVIRRFN